MHERIRDALLARWARVVTNHPVSTLAVAVVMASGAIALTAVSLQFKTDRSELVASDLPWNQRYTDYKRRYPRWDDVLIAIEGDPDDIHVDRLAREVAERLRSDPRVAAADAGFDPRDTPRLYQTAGPEDFDRALRGLRVLRSIAGADTVNSALATALAARAGQGSDAAEVQTLADLIAPFLAAARGETASFALPGFDDDQWHSYVSGSGRIRLIWVQFGGEDETASGIGDSLQWLRHTVDGIIAQREPPEIQWGVTGIPALEADETSQATKDSARASVVALILITILMVAVFRGVRVPLLATLSLLIGICWTFGWVVIAVGHLQLLSIVFVVILLGLGIDFALHIIARLELICDEHVDLTPAMERVFRAVGPGVLTGAITTAAAFAAISLTDFRGAAEMGIIAGGGILLCLVAVLSVFPALLAVTGRWKTIIRHRHGGTARPFGRGRFNFVTRAPVRVLIGSAVVMAGLIYFTIQVRYDPNVVNLQPPGVESVRWEHRIIADDARTTWSALVVTDAQHAADLVERLRAIDGVSDVGGMGMFFPVDRDDRRGAIEEMTATTASTIAIPAGPDSMFVILNQIAARLSGSPTETGRLLARIREAIETGRQLDVKQRHDAWSALNESFLAGQEEYRNFLDRALRTDPLGPSDLPSGLRARLVGRDDSWLLRVYPDAGAESVLHPDRLGPFVEALRSVAPEVIGPPVQILESSRLIQEAYVVAALLALPAILLLLVLDFRSVPPALCAVLPVVMGFFGAFGLMGLIGVPLNFANMIVMPIILGIGVDAGVHVVHRWRAEPLGQPAGLSGGTGRSITLTMLTTMIGFGCMMLAEHRGIRSLGFVMVAGLGSTLLACYTTLPAILHLRKPIQREFEQV